MSAIGATNTAVVPSAPSLQAINMAKTYAQIQKQIEELQREAEKLRRDEVDAVIARIKEAIQVYGLTAQDLGLTPAAKSSSRPARPAGKAAAKSRSAKFRDAEGNEWSGRGPRPKWLRAALAAGKALDDFAI
jgi:DNA-binding protein H-NS